MRLQEAIEKYPHIQEELEKRASAAFAAGCQSARDANAALARKVTPFLNGRRYGLAVRNLALLVLKGQIGVAALEGAAAFYGSPAESEATDA